MQSNIIALLLISLNFFSPYNIAGIHMPTIIATIIGLICFIQKPSTLPKGYSPYLLYMLIVPTTTSILMNLPGDIFQNIFPKSIILFSIWLLALNKKLDCNKVLQFYKYLVYAAILLFYIQEFSYTIFHIRPTIYLSFLENYYGVSTKEFAYSRATMDRSSSFFLEPAHFVQYIFPYFCIVLCNSLKKKKISKELLFIGLTITLVRSGCGYFCMAALLLYFILIYDGFHFMTKVIISLFIVLGIYLTMTFCTNNEIVSFIMGRMDEFSLSVNESGRQSGFLRMYRGYYIYDNLDVFNKIFGVGAGTLSFLADHFIMSGINYEGDYMNGVQSILNKGGIIGTMLFVFVYLRKQFSVSNQTANCIYVVMLALFFIENMLFDYKMFQYVLLAYCCTNRCESHTPPSCFSADESL